jgi:folate-binding Fe-S cluster repair protein YgfZ
MTSPSLEGNRVGERQGVSDVSHKRDRLRVSGDGRVNFLHGQCTNDIQRLAAGESCCAAFLNAKGRMRGEGQKGLA